MWYWWKVSEMAGTYTGSCRHSVGVSWAWSRLIHNVVFLWCNSDVRPREQRGPVGCGRDCPGNREVAGSRWSALEENIKLLPASFHSVKLIQRRPRFAALEGDRRFFFVEIWTPPQRCSTCHLYCVLAGWLVALGLRCWSNNCVNWVGYSSKGI